MGSWAGQVRRTGTLRDGGDGCRLSPNPEVAGSNPAPATKTAGQRPRKMIFRGLLLSVVNAALFWTRSRPAEATFWVGVVAQRRSLSGLACGPC